MLGKLNYLLILTFLTIGCSQSINRRSDGTIASVTRNTQTDYLVSISPNKTTALRHFRSQIQLYNTATGEILKDYSNRLPTWATIAIFEQENIILIGGADGHVYRVYTDEPELQIERYSIFSRPVRAILKGHTEGMFFASDSGGHIAAVAEYNQNQYDPLIRGRFYTNRPKIITFPRDTSTEVIDMLELTKDNLLLALRSDGVIEVWQKAGPQYRCATQPVSKQVDKMTHTGDDAALTISNRDGTETALSLNLADCSII